MKTGTSKTEVLHLSRNPVLCSLQVGGVSLKQMEKFKYLGVAFTSDEKQDKEFDVLSGKASAVMRALHHSVVLKRELSRKAKLLVFKSIFVPILIYGHESWVLIENVRSQMQASEMRFLQKIKCICLTNIVTLRFVNLSTSSRATSPDQKISAKMVWSCKQNALGTASQANFTC